MLLLLALILALLWVGGFGIFHVTSVLIHVLLVAAVISVLVHIINGRRAV
jgi:hypothetical protein